MFYIASSCWSWRRCTTFRETIAVMMNLVRIIWNGFQSVLDGWKFRNRILTITVDDLPDTLNSGYLYLIGSRRPWSAALLCPCGCRQTVQVSLLPKDSPSWTLQLEGRAKLPTLTPSVWRRKGCRAHFFLRAGEIVWCDKKGI